MNSASVGNLITVVFAVVDDSEFDLKVASLSDKAYL
jgi:hypothetical protein